MAVDDQHDRRTDHHASRGLGPQPVGEGRSDEDEWPDQPGGADPFTGRPA